MMPLYMEQQMLQVAKGMRLELIPDCLTISPTSPPTPVSLDHIVYDITA